MDREVSLVGKDTLHKTVLNSQECRQVMSRVILKVKSLWLRVTFAKNVMQHILIYSKHNFKGKQLDKMWLKTYNSILLGTRKEEKKKNRKTGEKIFSLGLKPNKLGSIWLIMGESVTLVSISYWSCFKYQIVI